MSYLLNKQLARKKYLKIFFIFLFCLLVFYFRISVFSKLSYVSHIVFRPIFLVGQNIGDNLNTLQSYLSSKNALMIENENYRNQYNDTTTKMANYNVLLDENLKLKEILDRKKEKVSLVLANILAKPNQSPYDTLLIDIGTNKNLVVGELVFAFGNTPIGRVKEVYMNSAKVALFSSPGEETEVVIPGKDVFMNLVGRGGGNFEMNLVKDLGIGVGTEVVLRGNTPYALGTVESILSDPRQAFDKALLISPVNIQQLKFVEVER